MAHYLALSRAKKQLRSTKTPPKMPSLKPQTYSVRLQDPSSFFFRRRPVALNFDPYSPTLSLAEYVIPVHTLTLNDAFPTNDVVILSEHRHFRIAPPNAADRQWRALLASLRLAALSPRGYMMVQYVGAGAVGSVYKAIHQTSRQTVAVKSIRHADLHRLGLREADVVAECALHSELAPHAHVVPLLERIRCRGVTHLVMQFAADGDLSAHVRSRRFGGRQRMSVVHQMLSALAHLHAQRVVHRDVKLENVLVEWTAHQQHEQSNASVTHANAGGTVSVHAMLCDFGLAVRLDGDNDHDDDDNDNDNDGDEDDVSMQREVATSTTLSSRSIASASRDGTRTMTSVSVASTNNTTTFTNSTTTNNNNTHAKQRQSRSAKRRLADLRASVGTQYTKAPELVLHNGGRHGLTPAVDVWAVGIILFTLAFGRTPWDVHTSPTKHGTDTTTNTTQMRHVQRRLMERMERASAQGAQHLDVLLEDGERDSISDNVLRLLSGLLQPNPTRRLSARAALEHAAFGGPRMEDVIPPKHVSEKTLDDATVDDSKPVCGLVKFRSAARLVVCAMKTVDMWQKSAGISRDGTTDAYKLAVA